MKNTKLSASILSADFTQLGDQIRLIEQAGVDWVHVDVMDGHFVPNITMGPFILEACRNTTSLPLDVHLMIETPEKYVEEFIRAGANNLTIHQEGNPNVHRTLQHIRSMNCRASVAINPGTSPESIEYLLPLVDMVLVMSVNPGYSGQEFLPHLTFRWMAESHPRLLDSCIRPGQMCLSLEIRSLRIPLGSQRQSMNCARL